MHNYLRTAQAVLTIRLWRNFPAIPSRDKRNDENGRFRTSGGGNRPGCCQKLRKTLRLLRCIDRALRELRAVYISKVKQKLSGMEGRLVCSEFLHTPLSSRNYFARLKCRATFHNKPSSILFRFYVAASYLTADSYFSNAWIQRGMLLLERGRSVVFITIFIGFHTEIVPRDTPLHWILSTHS